MNKKGMFAIIKSLVLFLCLTVFMTSFYGCEPLRKKFRREKKKDRELGFVPVLDPVDYEPARVSAKERYAYHYSLWKVWEKELAQNFSKDENNRLSDKRQKYLLAQMLTHLTEMKKWMVPEKAAEFDSSLDEIDKLQKEYSKVEALRSRFRMKSLLSRSSRKIREGFSPDAMEEYYLK